MRRGVTIGVGVATLVLLFVAAGRSWTETAPLGSVLAAFPLPAAAIIAAAAAAGALVTRGLTSSALTAEEAGRAGYAALMPAVGIAGVLLVIASVPPLSTARAAAALLLGAIALVAAWRCVELVSAGEPIGFESNWGGFGGGSSGWRLFPAAALAILALSFAGGALAVLVSEPAKTPETSVAPATGNTFVDPDNQGNAAASREADGSANEAGNAAVSAAGGGVDEADRNAAQGNVRPPAGT